MLSRYRAPVLDPPPDVVAARVVRALTRTLVLCCVAVVAAGLVAAGALAVAGDATERLTTLGLAPAVTMLGLGQAGGLVAAVVSAVGLRRVLAADLRATGGSGAGAAERVARRLGLVARGLFGACALGSAAWIVAEPPAAVAVLLGAAVSAQVAVLLLVLRTNLLHAAGR